MKIDDVVYLAQASSVLEASCEKPGNVTPTHSFSDSSYEDFLLGSVALGSSVRAAAEAGMRGEDIPIGRLILEGVRDIRGAHCGGNTHLGTLMLFIPIAAAAGRCLGKKIQFREGLQAELREVLAASTLGDSLAFYEAIKLADAGGLSSPLQEPRVPFLGLMKQSSEVDRIAEELSSGMRITFGFSVPAFELASDRSDDLGSAVVRTYLCILSKFPDTLIIKKAGIEKALLASDLATDVLLGDASVGELDGFLRSEGNSLNPGSTADLVAAAIFVSFLLECV
jgi:triphosphoribosyl-dephospho-CoA synthase